MEMSRRSDILREDSREIFKKREYFLKRCFKCQVGGMKKNTLQNMMLCYSKRSETLGAVAQACNPNT